MADKKNTTPIILSAFVFPGAGQMYNRHYVKGLVIILGATAVTIYLLYMIVAIVSEVTQATQVLSTDPTQMYLYVENVKSQVWKNSIGALITFTVVFIPLWIYGILDAWYQYRKD